MPMLSRAYVQTTSQYPYATMNATNLWVLLVGNAAPDNVPIWGVSADGLGFLLKPAILGKILFVIVSVFVLIKSILCKNIRTAFALCTLNGLAFFVLLPGMHERYLLYAVPMAICWLVWDMCRGGVPCFLITLVATLNVNLINPFRGNDVWNTVSMVGCIALVASLLVVAMPKTVNKVLYGIKKVPFPAWTPYVLLSVILLIEGSYIAYRNRPVVAPKGENIVLLENLSIRQSEQGYGTPKINRSVDSHMLIVGKRVYKNGLGAHAPSKFVYELPNNADTLFIGAGIDDECYDQGSAIFIIRVDGKKIAFLDAMREHD